MRSSAMRPGATRRFSLTRLAPGAQVWSARDASSADNDPRGKSMSRGRTQRACRLAAIALATVAVAALPGGAAATGTGAAAPTIEAVSTLPQYVSGGDVLVEIRLHDDAASAKHLRVERNGVDVTGSFRTMPDGSLLGL